MQPGGLPSFQHTHRSPPNAWSPSLPSPAMDRHSVSRRRIRAECRSLHVKPPWVMSSNAPARELGDFALGAWAWGAWGNDGCGRQLELFLRSDGRPLSWPCGMQEPAQTSRLSSLHSTAVCVCVCVCVVGAWVCAARCVRLDEVVIPKGAPVSRRWRRETSSRLDWAGVLPYGNGRRCLPHIISWLPSRRCNAV